MKTWNFLFAQIVTYTLLFSLSLLFIRLHITQMAYRFEERKDYERSLMEEQMRLRLELYQALSPLQFEKRDFKEPLPEEVVRIP